MSNPIPQGVIPYLICAGGTQAVAFYQRALGAQLDAQLIGEDGRVGHAEMLIGQARFMLADEYPEMDILGPKTLGGTSISLALYVDDVDTSAARAIEAGAELLHPIKDEFYGDRVARLQDPFGHRWSLHTRIEDISPEEVNRRFKAM